MDNIHILTATYRNVQQIFNNEKRLEKLCNTKGILEHVVGHHTANWANWQQVRNMVVYTKNNMEPKSLSSKNEEGFVTLWKTAHSATN